MEVPDFLKDALISGVPLAVILPFLAQAAKWLTVQLGLDIGGGLIYVLCVMVAVGAGTATGDIEPNAAFWTGLIVWLSGTGIFEVASHTGVMPEVKRIRPAKPERAASVGGVQVGSFEARDNVAVGGRDASVHNEKE